MSLLKSWRNSYAGWLLLECSDTHTFSIQRSVMCACTGPSCPRLTATDGLRLLPRASMASVTQTVN